MSIVMTPFIGYITNVTQEEHAVVSLSNSIDFIIGTVLRIKMPKEYGMFQINDLQAKVILVQDSFTIQIDINTLEFDAYVSYAGQTIPYVPLCIPIGVYPTNIEDSQEYRKTQYNQNASFYNESII